MAEVDDDEASAPRAKPWEKSKAKPWEKKTTALRGNTSDNPDSETEVSTPGSLAGESPALGSVKPPPLSTTPKLLAPLARYRENRNPDDCLRLAQEGARGPGW